MDTQREIKFRAWDKKRKKMECFDLWDIFDDYATFNKKDHAIMQFTGLKDKNGKEIWEGDIINSENNCVAKVRFNDGRFEIEFLPQKGFEGRIDDLCYAVEMKVEVIGNIYENPELLK